MPQDRPNRNAHFSVNPGVHANGELSGNARLRRWEMCICRFFILAE